MPKRELHTIERFEDREQQFGITLKGLLVVIDDGDGDDGDGIDIFVNGEVHAVDESKITQNWKIVVSALTREGKIMDTDCALYMSEDFMGFASLECSMVDLMEKPTAVRIYPQKL